MTIEVLLNQLGDEFYSLKKFKEFWQAGAGTPPQIVYVSGKTPAEALTNLIVEQEKLKHQHNI